MANEFPACFWTDNHKPPTVVAMALGIVSLAKILFCQLMAMVFLRQSAKRRLGEIYTSRIFLVIASALLVQVLAPNSWVIYGGLAALMLIFGSKTDHAPGTFLLLHLIVPTFQYQWVMGGIPIIGLNTKIFIGLAAGALVLFKGGRSYRFGPEFWIVLSFVALFDIFSHARGTAATNIAREMLQTSLNLVIPIIAMASLISRVKDVRIFGAYVIAATISLTTIVAFESASGWNFYRSIYAHVGIPPVWDQLRWRNGLLRASGPMLEATSMGFVLAILTLFTWSVRGVTKSKNWTWVVTAAAFLGVYLTQSRNPIVGVILGMAAWYLFRRSKKANFSPVLLSVGMVVVAIVGIVNSDGTTRSQKAGPESTLDYRLRLMERGVEEVRKHPILGASKVEVDKKMEDLRQGEGIIDYVNSYLYIALLSGLIGLLIGLYALLRIPNDIAQFYKKRRYSDPSGMLTALFSATIAFLAMSYFTWIFAGILTTFLLLQSVMVRLRNRPPFPPTTARNTNAFIPPMFAFPAADPGASGEPASA